MRLRRRTLLGAGLAVPITGSLTACGDTHGQTGQVLASAARLPEAYATPLPLPPVKRPAGGLIEIAQRHASVEILPGLKTEMMTYDGVFPGPTLETRRGETVTVRHTSSLTLPTATHLHGGHTPAESDGWPTDLLVPPSFNTYQVPQTGHDGHAPMADPLAQVSTGERDYRYPLDQPATTLWYHDHRMDFTAPQVWRGLAGFHIVRDAEEDALSLPRGEREIPLMIADRAFDEDGALRYPALDPELLGQPGVEDRYMAGVLGDVILVNGAPWPEAEVDAAQYRLRLLNGSNARRYELSLRTADGKPLAFTQIGSDGGLLARPVQHDAITMASGERFDVVVDFRSLAPGTTVELRNALGTGRTAQVMRFRIARRATDDVRVPERLADVPEPEKPDGAVVRRWHFRQAKVHGRKGWGINGKPFDPAVPQAQVPLGSTEIWEFFTDAHHPVHVHLSPFQVLRRGNRGPGPMDHGWKDTVDVRPYEAVRVRVRFEKYAGRFLIHCHNLEHEDMAMMAGFETV
ncbi:multicopper oxidase family protein [Nocardioides albus]|uniref:FtsP/CotA-like multicopper oxidase with cupredoxin domain n=1 Tax=Nocardioides albus TaxID=1841 RepID=A0A7W5F7I8_9ACTN|nr:multicopper oxidase domain-containing protein [Nocardioides albus]MBB3087912.1 FtsP/CotA-like multicopper oxidase with cupredoxin domain [Nocardioides albus]GGU21244.1 spore coat protein A [Nocardioides albus]